MEDKQSLELNGVHLCLLSQKYVDEHPFLTSRELVRKLAPDMYLYQDCISDRGDLYKAAGYDTNKIDFGTPMGWHSQPEQVARFETGEYAVWSYEIHSHGAPVWDSEAWARLTGVILTTLKLQDTERRREWRFKTSEMTEFANFTTDEPVTKDEATRKIREILAACEIPNKLEVI